MHASALTARPPTLDGNAHWHLTEREENGAMDGILTDIPAKAAARTWLSDFEAALASGEAARIAALFAEDCHWRDLLAFTWDLHTTSGADAIAERIVPTLARM